MSCNFFEKNDNFWHLKKKFKFLTIFLHSNGNFPEGQLQDSAVISGHPCRSAIVYLSVLFLFHPIPSCNTLADLSPLHPFSGKHISIMFLTARVKTSCFLFKNHGRYQFV